MSNVFGIFGENTDVFALIGALALTYWAWQVSCSFWSGLKAYVLGRALGLSTNLKSLGDWAVVTGSTDGIGKAYALELASMGLNIVLVSRNPDKLQDVANDIGSRTKVQTKCVAIDFTQGPEIYTKVKAALTGLDIGVLVNNVGMSYDYPEFYAEIPSDQKIRQMLSVNVNSVAEMTRIVLPAMSEKRKGAIINVSSASGLRPTPMLSLYSATKAFVHVFSNSVQDEYRSKGIIVQCVMPFFVATKLSKIKKPTHFIPNSLTYARSALKTVGIEDTTFGFYAHALQGFAVSRMPQRLYAKFSFNTLLPVRARAKQKLQEKKE